MISVAEQIVNAAVAAINAVLPPEVRAYSTGDVPPARPSTYVEVDVSRRFLDDERRADGSLSMKSFRIGTRVCAKSKVNGFQAQHDVTRGLEEKVLTLAELGDTTPVEFETEDDLQPTSGWFSALTDWTVNI